MGSFGWAAIDFGTDPLDAVGRPLYQGWSALMERWLEQPRADRLSLPRRVAPLQAVLDEPLGMRAALLLTEHRVAR